jgi:hypothetical protein
MAQKIPYHPEIVLDYLRRMDADDLAACLHAIRCEFMGGVDWEKLRAEPRFEDGLIVSVGLVPARPDELVEPNVTLGR